MIAMYLIHLHRSSALPGRGAEHAPASFQRHQAMLPPLLPQVGQKQRVLCVLQSTRVVKNARIE